MAKSTLPKPVYAYVGVTDLAVEVVRDLVTETQTRIAGVQKDVTARVADVQKTAGDPKALRERATTVVSARVDALAKDAKARREAIESRVAELQAEAKAYPGKVQKLVDDNVSQATDTYAGLVKRGETLVGRVRRQQSTQATAASAKTTVAKAKTTTTQAKKAVDAETTATKKTATARKTAAKKSTAKKSTSKTAASKSTAKSTTSAPATKSAAKKAPARKAPAKATTTAQSSAKATATAAKKTASNAAQAATEAAEKVGD
jgi:heparin binding hemagglutinin HbhA